MKIAPPRLDKIVNPIGCGDCLAAGIAAGIAESRGLPEAIRLGFACAADNCRTLLAGRLDRAEVERLEARVTIEQA